jgi:hypothetical protein
LNYFGVTDTDDNQLELVKKVFYQDYSLALPEIKSLEPLLINLILGNNQKRIINCDLLNKNVGSLWENICYNSPAFRLSNFLIFRNSRILKYYDPQISTIRFYLKKAFPF